MAVKAWGAVIVVTAVLAVVRLLHHDTPERIVPVLGFVDHAPSAPPPAPSARPSSARPK
jgi:hypothetical protein